MEDKEILEQLEEIKKDPAFNDLWESCIDERILINNPLKDFAATFYLLGVGRTR